jgi:predicted extracellular nuclease
MVLRHHCDSILSADSTAHILVIGDMNSDPQNDLQPLTLLPLNIKSSIGTHRYQGRWSQLDQAFVSPSLAAATLSVFAPDWLLEPDNKYLGYKPRRTFVGFRYNPDGFSDHLPIVVNLK